MLLVEQDKPRYRVEGDEFVQVSGPAPVIDVEAMEPWSYAGQQSQSPWQNSIYDGGKYAGGFGPTQLFHADYWTMRMRSSQLFMENLYARGMIRRLITNEINTGLTPEACPDDVVLGISDDELNNWTEIVESRHNLWAKTPKLCDYYEKATFGAIQRAARMEALISGDVLVVLHHNRKTDLPQVELVSGSAVQTPLGGTAAIRKNHTVEHGVEKDARGRIVAHHVRQEDGTSKRVPCFGEKSGRRISWLVYGTEKRLDDVRGMPLLAIVLQSLKEVDRYRDAAQRKAVINSLLAMFIKKGEDKAGTLPVTGGVVRRNTTTGAAPGNEPRNYNLAGQIPGVVFEELQHGEEPVGFDSSGTDINFPVFEEAIIQSVAWANEIPPEILKLAFSNNYSASQAAINEFKIYLERVWVDFGETFCTPIYIEWLTAEVLKRNIRAASFMQSLVRKGMEDIHAAWVQVDWYGSIKPSTDMLKQAKGSELLIEHGWTTNAKESRMLTGTKYGKNLKRLRRENEQLAHALEPMAEFKQKFGIAEGETITEGPVTLDEDQVMALVQEQIEAGQDSEFIAGFIEELTREW